jgi:hypothetical protein
MARVVRISTVIGCELGQLENSSCRSLSTAGGEWASAIWGVDKWRGMLED